MSIRNTGMGGVIFFLFSFISEKFRYYGEWVNFATVQRLQEVEKKKESNKQKCSYLQEQVNKRTKITFPLYRR